MSTAPVHTNMSNGASSAHELFALTDEQILQIEPDAEDIEVFSGERSDQMDPLREDLELLTSAAGKPIADGAARSNGKGSDDGLKAVATSANATAKSSQSGDAAATHACIASVASKKNRTGRSACATKAFFNPEQSQVSETQSS